MFVGKISCRKFSAMQNIPFLQATVTGDREVGTRSTQTPETFEKILGII